VWFVLDATHTFDIATPDREVVPPVEIARGSLHSARCPFAGNLFIATSSERS
jgi:hypothetical protein